MGVLIALAPLDPYTTRAGSDAKAILATRPFDLGLGVSLRATPKWLGAEGLLDTLNPRQRYWVKSAEHCLWYHLKSHSGPEDELAAIQRLVDANLSIWLARPSGLGFEVVLFPQQAGRSWKRRSAYTVSKLTPHSEYVHQGVGVRELEMARRLHRAMGKQARGSAGDIAKRFLQRGLLEEDWFVRYLMIWIGLEALFGTQQEVSHRLSLRIAFFLAGKDSKQRLEQYSVAKECYRWRSLLVHGVSLKKLKSKKSEELLLQSEMMLQSSFRRVLSDAKIQELFAGKARENYLDGLLFQG